MTITYPSSTQQPQLPWCQTPLKQSKAMSLAAGCKVYMKLENLQPSGSYKSRGMGNMYLRSLASLPDPSRARFYCSSGGNAGLAAATAGKMLGVPTTVVVSKRTSDLMKEKIRDTDADLHVFGDGLIEADEYMREELMRGDDGAVYCPPFDHPYVWEGNSTLVSELAAQLPESHQIPDAIVFSVGGGGLFNGIVAGMKAHGWDSVPIIAVETRGADSLATAMLLDEHHMLPAITSRATSLGARRVSKQTWEYARHGGRDAGLDVRSVVLSDDEALMGCVKLAEDERLLVEDACGVSVATVYNGALRRACPELREDSLVVVIVCGGSNVTMEMLMEAKAKNLNGEDTTIAESKKSVLVTKEVPSKERAASSAISPTRPPNPTRWSWRWKLGNK
ncbi:hypothetical protein EYR41_004853 [Orbilia oligospora]|uniref:L-serine ammonia-lyase n=1 Tax=Orbilia oligospora TaxID=2813651 RepID=A0A7C8P712_ORBOL|nr:hypothetical protein TWF751_010823 [Orbilia oligospora]TGJ68767.1 hypothetical protein EYR41_004853 [Orbilia oligospora]